MLLCYLRDERKKFSFLCCLGQNKFNKHRRIKISIEYCAASQNWPGSKLGLVTSCQDLFRISIEKGSIRLEFFGFSDELLEVVVVVVAVRER